MLDQEWQLRGGQVADVPSLALLFDMANAGDVSTIWGKEAGAYETWIDVCARHMTNPASEVYYGNSIVAEVAGKVAGALFFLKAEAQPPGADFSKVPKHMRAFSELRSLAPAGIFVRDIAVFPEYRGHRLATRMLDVAFNFASLTKQNHVTVIVHETNTKQLEHYYKRGMSVIAQRPVLEHNQYAPESQWLLLKLDIPSSESTKCSVDELKGKANVQ